MPARTVNNIEAESSRKRSRRAEPAASDEEEVDVQPVRSTIRGDNRKRVRRSDAESSKDERRSGHEPTSNLTDANGPTLATVEDQNSPDTPPKTQYELLRDNNFDHLRHEAADDQRATQRLRFRPNLLGDNAIADNGIIESITCVNFMCHQRLHCELGPLLNFIVGENGSGKSAILTAITLCLGGKASSTNRGGSLKSFVKEGCERGVLSVKIKNAGQDAYRHDIYGDSIIVERHFNKSGNSGFKVKTALNQTYSTKKQEVEEIVEYYALQVDNPLNVLSQDNARQFLNTSTKTQKYKFFIEGVQLQQLDNDYRLISESLEQMVAKVPDQEERVKHAKAMLDKATQLKGAIEGNREVHHKLKTLRHQVIWAQVEEQERILAERDQAIAQVDVKIAEAQCVVEEKTSELRNADEKIENAVTSVKVIKKEESDHRRRVEEATEVFQSMQGEIQHLHVEEREVHTQLKNSRDDMEDLTRKIASEQKRLEDTNGEAHSVKLRELEQAKEKVAGIENNIENTKSREPHLINQLDKSKKVLAAIDDEHRRKREEIDASQTKIQSLVNNRGSGLEGYDSQVSNLLKMIEREGGFDTKPIGPLGIHIQLLNPQWSSILEKTLGQNLSAFLVTSKRDQKILFGFMNRLGIRGCPILIGGGHTLDLAGKEPDAQFDTILRVLKFDNQMVRDQMVINHMIEQVILVPDRNQAQDIMFSNAPPRNVKACLSFHDRKRGQGLRLVNNGGSISTTPVQPNPTTKPRMKTDSDSQISFHQESLHQLEIEYRVLEGERRRAQQEAQCCQSELDSLKKERTALVAQLRNFRVQVEQIEADLDQFDGADNRLKILQEQLKDTRAKHDQQGLQYGNILVAKTKRNKESERASKCLRDEKLLLKDFEARLERADDKLKRVQEMRNIVLTELNEAFSTVEKLKGEKPGLETRRERQKVNVEEMIVQAERYSDKRTYIPPKETYRSLTKQYEALNKRLHDEEKKSGMSDEQISDNFAHVKKAYNKVVADLTSIKQVNSGLRDTLNLRLEKWRKFQRYISSQSRANFIYLLSERGFRGQLLLDHERKALELQVEPDRTEKRAAGRNTKTLSGGEKSFSSICLLLSIWEAMGSPLRCLDEFDVFMDNVNRAISTNMLITAARRSVNRQYIFITPNAIEGRNTLDKDVKIIRLTDPRQRTLADH
ncbi:P-loop containing nucleoside triphosphate hydrolase protein [Lasiosphaeria ovina]|uniref:P-loop containing nucleoside triphosphate hydrolase protein n=1 Tax=Lasiosphaeria ovina TaxID=92902 RepID=A0AAE0KFY1_9PEZI|nr:P-loop containing nucleoside triphosphate hydrolase protein [Lasiosphaeria ovina]